MQFRTWARTFILSHALFPRRVRAELSHLCKQQRWDDKVAYTVSNNNRWLIEINDGKIASKATNTSRLLWFKATENSQLKSSQTQTKHKTTAIWNEWTAIQHEQVKIHNFNASVLFSSNQLYYTTEDCLIHKNYVTMNALNSWIAFFTKIPPSSKRYFL